MPTRPNYDQLPEAVRGFVHISEVDDGEFFAGELFRHKFDDAPPSLPHHVLAFLRLESGSLVPAAYCHFWMFGDICLVGGMSTDGRAFAKLDEPQRAELAAVGGMAHYLLHYGFARFTAVDAFFGHVGDERARVVDLAAGFVDTPHPPLMVHVPRELPDWRLRALIAKAHSLGPF